MRRACGWLLLVAALASTGCHLRRYVIGLAAPTLRDSLDALEQESDLEVARAVIPGQMLTLEGLLVSAPKQPILLELVARGWVEFAFGILEDDYESLPNTPEAQPQRQVLAARATALYDRSLKLAVRRLEVADRKFREAFAADVRTLDAELAKLKKDSAPALTFAGLALASSANLNRGDPSRVVDLPKAVAMLRRARDLAPGTNDGGPSLVLGLVYGEKPSLGGRPEEARKFFDEAIAISDGKYLLARVMKARHYAVAIHDRVLYEKLLTDVLAAPPDLAPDKRLPNELARRRAARYLAEADRYF
jgi:hypothetical protein